MRFQGRINRAKYWIAALVYLSVTIVIVALGFFFNFNVLFFVLFTILSLAIIVSGIAIGIKRLHDRDKSGWWLLLFYLLPPLFDGMGRTIGLPLVLDLASFVVSMWMIVELGFLRGTSGPNQFGPDPLGG